jgi:predicted N-acyltransferase
LTTKEIELRVCQSLSEIPRESWQALLHEDDNPFVSWPFLNALEQTGCVSQRRGWWPCHLTCWQGETLVAAAPAYLKGDGMGDFSRDWGLSDVARQFGISMYPKMVIGVPFSPVTGRRFLIADHSERQPLVRALLHLAHEVARQNELAAVQVLYHSAEEVEAIESAGLAVRTMIQYHWQNYDYETADDWLARLRSKRRNQVKRERAAPAQQGIDIHTVLGDELRQNPLGWAEQAYGLYETTCQKYMWGGTYLNRDFYRFLFQEMADNVELVTARRDGKLIAGAINLYTPTHLFGRYWGCYEEHRYLHFNVCLYHSIDECIERGLQVFEGGAGGEHKLMRGFEPSLVYCSHSFLNEELNAVVAHALESDSRLREKEIERYQETRGLAKRGPAQPGS